MRDKFGNVVEGAVDDIQSVFYVWALTQDAVGMYSESGQFLPPRWQLREMMVAAMQAIV